MFFPNDLSSLRRMTYNILSYPDDERMKILDEMISAMEKMHENIDIDILNLMYECKKAVESGNRDDINNFKRGLIPTDKILACVAFDTDNFAKMVPDIQEYHNIYIFILSHPKNSSSVIKSILSRMNYLDKITRDVTFIMPGYKRASMNDRVVNEEDENMHLTFDENLFIKYVQYLEDKSHNKFCYQDECELLFVPKKDIKTLDFDNMFRLNLDKLKRQKDVDPIQLLIRFSNRMRNNTCDVSMIDLIMYEIISELSDDKSSDVYKVFIAGSKKLKSERTMIREELSKIQNDLNINIRAFSYEDFGTSLTGLFGGRQEEYNIFIENEADTIIFVFNEEAGPTTEEEFFLAYDSFKNSGKPKIFIYAWKHNNIFDRPDKVCIQGEKLANIRNIFTSRHPEYYVEFENLEDLKYLIFRDMTRLLNRK